MTRSTRARRAGAAGVLAALAVAVPVGIAAAGGPGGPGGTGGGSGGDDRPRGERFTVHLTVGQSRFTPASVEVPAGATVRFVVRNLDPIDHELIVGGPAVQQRHEIGRDAGHLRQEPGAVSVAAGKTASTTWTAPESPGPVTFACHLPGHFAYGMVGTVLVTTRS